MFSLPDIMSKEKLAEFCKENHITKLSLFGSALQDDLHPDSDIDLLVVFDDEHVPGLFDLSRMEIELTDTLNRKVDLRTPEELSHYFRDEVVRTAVVQYSY